MHLRAGLYAGSQRASASRRSTVETASARRGESAGSIFRAVTHNSRSPTASGRAR
ncbi:hypothetical protein ACFFX0_15545 [Citricoccus parietis]|uniref:Uncharacterized protein n=1 Tax=Citricoccus parietis TaxID=592307 RepID=A0ABV5G0S4_9MICC